MNWEHNTVFELDGETNATGSPEKYSQTSGCSTGVL